MPTPLSVTLAELQTFAADPHSPPLIDEMIEAIGDDALPETCLDLAPIVDEPSVYAVGWICERLYPAAIRAWALDCTDQALADAQRTLDLGRPRMGVDETPRKVIGAATRILAALRQRLPVSPHRGQWRDDWYAAWDGYAPWYLSTYLDRRTDTPYLGLAQATVATLSLHGLAADPGHPPRYPPGVDDVLEASALAARTARLTALRRDWSELPGRLPRSQRLVQIDSLARLAGEQRTDWCLAQLRAYLSGEVVAPEPIPVSQPGRARGHLAVVRAA